MPEFVFDLQLFDTPPDGGGTPPDGGGTPPGSGGSSSSSVSWNGATEITSAATTANQNYISSTADQNALLINTSDDVVINNPTVTKSGDSDGGDNCNFYGINSGIMCMGGGSTSIVGGTVTANATGANGVFSYGGNGGNNGAAGDGTAVYVSNMTITTTGGNSGGIMTTGGGKTVARNLTITTEGQSSAPIRSDRGGGEVTVEGGTYISNGLGSPAIYSTAAIEVSNATLVSNLSEGVCIEGKNSIALTNCTLTANNTQTNGNATFLDTIMIYQSMSGDADSGQSSFSMIGGVLNSRKGHVFHVTNTSALITLQDVEINNADSDGILLSVCDDGWSGASNIATLNAIDQELDGDILVGSDSTLTLNLTSGTTLRGAVNGTITNASGSVVSSNAGTVNVTIDDTGKWYLSGNSSISSFNGDAANVVNNGYTLFVNGIALDGTTDQDDSDADSDTDTDDTSSNDDTSFDDTSSATADTTSTTVDDDTTSSDDVTASDYTYSSEDGSIYRVLNTENIPNNTSITLDNNSRRITDLLDLSNAKIKVNLTIVNGNQNVTLTNYSSSNVTISSDASGKKYLQAGSRGDLFINESTDTTVSILGGTGRDTIYAGGGENELIDLSAGGADRIFAPNGANIQGLDAESGAAFVTDLDNIYDAINDGEIAFDRGSFSIEGAGGSIVVDADTRRVGEMSINLLDSNGNVNRVMNSYARGGTVDGSSANMSAIYVGNYNGAKTGTSVLIGSSNNDTFLAGAYDSIVTGFGTNYVELRNDSNGGATIDQTSLASKRTVNNISGYDPIINTIQIGDGALSSISAYFEDGNLVVKHGKTTNYFMSDGTAQLAAIDEVLDVPIDELLQARESEVLDTISVPNPIELNCNRNSVIQLSTTREAKK